MPVNEHFIAVGNIVSDSGSKFTARNQFTCAEGIAGDISPLCDRFIKVRSAVSVRGVRNDWHVSRSVTQRSIICGDAPWVVHEDSLRLRRFRAAQVIGVHSQGARETIHWNNPSAEPKDSGGSPVEAVVA